MASGLYEKVRIKGRTEGLAKGRIEEARPLCLGLAKSLHPAVAPRVVPVIEACSELTRLRRWALRAPAVSDAAFARRVTGGSSGSTRQRAPRPARKPARTPAR